jgi:hypothetical protein
MLVTSMPALSEMMVVNLDTWEPCPFPPAHRAWSVLHSRVPSAWESSTARTCGGSVRLATSAAHWTPERIQEADAASADSPEDDASLVQSSGLTHYESVYWSGRLYSTRGGQEGSCTGSGVKSDSRLVVATAAHCLHLDREYATNVRSIPAWDGADKPLLTWGADFYQVTTSWHASMDAQHDTAFIKMKPREEWGGRTTYLADVAGAPRVDFPLAAPRLHYEMFGYSQVSGFTPAPS